MGRYKERIRKLTERLSAVYLAYRRRDTPFLAKLMAGLTIAYALSPIDLIPDFIPVLGLLDDLVILPLLLWLALKLIPKQIMQECTEQARDLWKDGKPKALRYAIPILLFWAVIAAAILYAVFK